MRDYIEINKELVPYEFSILLAGEWFTLRIGHNKTADLFTISLYKNDELIAVEPLILNAPLFRDIYQPSRFPAISLVAYAPNETAKAAGFEALGETVFLSIDDEGDEANG